MVSPHTRLTAEPPPWASFGRNVPRPLSSRTLSVWHYFLLIAKPPLLLFSGSRDHRLPLLPAPLDRHIPILAADSPLLPPADRVDHRYACPGPLASGSLLVTPSATETGTSPELATPPTPAPKPGPRIELRDGFSPPTAPPQPTTADPLGLLPQPRGRSSPLTIPPRTPEAQPPGPCCTPRDQPAPLPRPRRPTPAASSWPPLFRLVAATIAARRAVSTPRAVAPRLDKDPAPALSSWTHPRLPVRRLPSTPKRPPPAPSTTRTWHSTARSKPDGPERLYYPSSRPPPAHHADVERHIVHGRLALLETHAAGLLHLVGTQSQAISIANWRLLALESAPPPLAPPSTASRLQAASDYQGQPTPTFDLRSTLAGHRRPAPEQSPVGSQPDSPPSLFGDGAAQAPPWSVATRPRIVSHPARLSRPADFLVPSWPPGDCPPPSAPLRRVLRREGSGINQLGSPSSAPGFVAPPNTVLPPPPHPPPSPPAPSSPDDGA